MERRAFLGVLGGAVAGSSLGSNPCILHAYKLGSRAEMPGVVASHRDAVLVLEAIAAEHLPQLAVVTTGSTVAGGIVLERGCSWRTCDRIFEIRKCRAIDTTLLRTIFSSDYVSMFAFQSLAERQQAWTDFAAQGGRIETDSISIFSRLVW